MDHDLQVYADIGGSSNLVGRLWLREKHGRETATFRYDPSWLKNKRSFALAPSLALGEGAFHVDDGIFNAFRDSAPDRWGQKLMRQRERNRAREAGTKPRTLYSGDFLVGVEDETRLGALRFKHVGDKDFLSQSTNPVPPLIDLRKLLGATNRLERGRERKGDLEFVLAPGGSLGGARPKATVRGKDGILYVAKFPWAKDEWSVIRWEALALDLAGLAGINTPKCELVKVQGNGVLLLERFDREIEGKIRLPFMSAMTALEAKDHEEHSYLEVVDVLRQTGGFPETDVVQLWRRMLFNILISNTDDHLRNHALLHGDNGWYLSPAYDMNPTPADISGGHHILAINEVEHSGSLDLALSVAEQFGQKLADAKQVARDVATVISSWHKSARDLGIEKTEIERMSSAFKTDEIEAAMAYGKKVAVALPKSQSRKSTRARSQRA